MADTTMPILPSASAPPTAISAAATTPSAPASPAPTPTPDASAPVDFNQPGQFDAALDAASTSIGSQLQDTANTEAASDSPLDKGLEMLSAGADGIAKGVVNTLNLPHDIGLPVGKINPMSTPVLSDIYKDAADLDRRSGWNGLSDGVGQFAIGLLGAGKLMALTKAGDALEAGGVVGKIAKGAMITGAAASTSLDPQSSRISDMVQQVPALRNPVTQFLASNPDDSAAMGRLKNGLENAGLEAATVATFSAALRAFKLLKAGAKPAVTQAALDDLHEAVQGRTPGTGWGGDDQVAPTDPVAAQGEQDGRTTAGVDAAVHSTSASAGVDAAPVASDYTPPPEAYPVGSQRVTVTDAAGNSDSFIQAPQETTNDGSANPLSGVAGGDTTGNTSGDGAGAGGDGVARPADGEPEPVADPADTVGSIISTARSTGALKGRIPTAMVQQAIDAAPSLAKSAPQAINGVSFRVIPHAEMTAMGKAVGADTSNWLASANPKAGAITISDRLLERTPAMQATVIAHEVGHLLQPEFDRALLRADQSVDLKELKAASRVIRPEAHANADAAVRLPKGTKGTGIGAAKQLHSYLNSREELFADSFALWKTDPAQFAKVAPKTNALFDEHFHPWIDTDLTTLAPTTAKSIRQGIAGQPIPKGQPIDRAVPDQRAANFTGARMVQEPDEIAAVQHAYEADTTALQTYGDRATAEAAGYRFGQSNLPWQKLLADGGLQDFTNRVAEQSKAQLDQMKGGAVLSDKRVAMLVNQRVKLFNEDPADVLGELQAAGHNANAMIANMEASFAIANKAAGDLYDLVKNNAVGNYAAFGGDEGAAKAAIGPRLALFIEATGNAQAIRSAGGRIVRRNRGMFKVTPETLAKIRTGDPDALSSLIALTKGDPQKMAQMASETFLQRWLRAGGTLFANNLLWNWKTHVANLTGNAFMLSTTPAMRAAGSVMLGSAGNDVRTVALREYRYMLQSMIDAAQFSKDAYLLGDSIINPHNAEAWQALHAQSGGQGMTGSQQLAKSIGLVPVKQPQDLLTNGFHGTMFALTQPTRALGMSDEFIKQMSYRASVLSRASLDADRLGLHGQSYTDYLKSKLAGAFDEAGVATDKDALYDAQVRTFSQPLLQGTMGQKAVKFAHDLGSWTRFILPFQRTPINLFRYSVKLSPILNLAQGEYRQMISGALGPQRQADAWGQMMMGTGLVSSAMGLWASGMLTGSPPIDPAHRKALQDTGWQPYSLVWSEANGQHHYVPYSRFDPVGMTLGVVSDIGQIIKQGQLSDVGVEQLALPLAMAVIQNLNSRTYLANLTQTLDAISSAQGIEEGLPKVAANMVADMIPASTLWTEVNPDPYMREARGIADTIMSKLPGFSDKLAPARDSFGAVLPKYNTLLYSDRADDVVDAEQQRMLQSYGIGVTPPASQPWGGVDLRGYKLPNGQTAFDRYQELSQQPEGAKLSMKQSLANLIKSREYQAMVDGTDKGTRLYAMQQVVDKYRAAAKKQLLRENQPLALAIGQRQQSEREAARNNLLGQDQTAARNQAIVNNTIRNANAAFGIK